MYKKPIRSIGKFKAYLVDSDYVKIHGDENFTNFGEHYRFPFIPKNEFWIDKNSQKDEWDFFIDHMLVEYELMETGSSYGDAFDYADQVEKRERNKRENYKHSQNKMIDTADDDVDAEFWKRLSDCDVSVYLVDGEKVRDLFDTSFVEGGHDKVYHYIPHNQIWIDKDLPDKDRLFVLVHESVERDLMKKGSSYSDAHNEANNREFRFRHKMPEK